MSKQVITIGYLKDFIGDVVNINPSYTDMTYCPTYDELTNGNLVTNFKDNTLPLSIINGIYVNPNFTSSKTYSNDQLVIREHLQLKYVELQNIDIYADNTSISCCGSSTTLSATGYFKLVTKVEEGTLTTSTTQMSQAISAIYSDSASYTTINASTITFNKNSINYPTSNIATSRTSRVTGSYTYTFNGGKSITKTNTIDITQNANNVGDWINTTTTTNSISVTPSSMLFSASGGEQTYTVTRYYTQYQEKYDSCSALIDTNNFNTSSIVIPQNATTSGDFECTTTTVSVGVQDSGASERNGILTVFYDGKSATCSLTQSENLIGDWIKDGEPYEYNFSISISPKENLDCDGGETYATSILSWKQNYIIKDSLGNIVYNKTENESNNVTNNTTWSSDRGTINSNGKLTFPMSIEDGITKTNVTGKYSSFTDTDYITQLNCSSENYCILGITNTQNGGVNQEVSINEGDMTEIKIYSINPYGNETIPSISSSKPYDSNLISVTASEYNTSNDFSRNFNIIAKKYDGNDTYKTTNITINNECAEYVIPIKILKVDFTAITTEYDIRVLSTTIGCCDTSANVTVEGCSRSGITHTDETETEWGNWSTWTKLSSSDYSLSYSKEIEENDTNAEQIYTVTATGKGNYNGKTASATITQEAGPCAEVNCFTLNIDGRNWELSLPNKATSDVTYKFNATNGHVNNNLTYPNWTQTIVVNKGESFSSLRTDENTFCSNATLISISPEYDNEYIYMCTGIINIGGNEVTSTTYEYRASINTIGKCETTTTATVYYTPTYHYSDGTSIKGSEATFNGSKTLSYKYHDDSNYGSIDVNNNIHLLDVDVKITFTHNGSQQEIITSTTQDAGPCTCECEVESISVNPSTYSYSSLTELKTFYVTITDNSNYCDECNGGFTVYDSNGLVIDNGTSSFSLFNTGGTYTIKSNDDPSKTCTLTLIEYEKPVITVKFNGTRNVIWTNGMDEYYGCEGSNELPEMIVTDSNITYTIEGVSSVPDELRIEISSITYSVGYEYSGSTSYKPSSLSGNIIIPSCSKLVSSDICSKVEQECQPEIWDAKLTNYSNYDLEVIDNVENKEADAIITSTTYEYRASVNTMGKCDTTTTARVYCTPINHYSDGSSVEGSEFEITSKTLTYRYTGETTFKTSLSENETSSSKDVEVKITFTHNGQANIINEKTTQAAGPCTPTCNPNYDYSNATLSFNASIGSCDTTPSISNVKITNVAYTSSTCDKSTIDETVPSGFYSITSTHSKNTGSTRNVTVSIKTSSTYGSMTASKTITQAGGCVIYTGSTTVYEMKVVDTTVDKCATTAPSITVQGRSYVVSGYSDGSTISGTPTSWTDLTKDTDYTLNIPTISQNTGSTSKSYTVTATGKGTYAGKSATGKITQAGGCVDRICKTASIDCSVIHNWGAGSSTFSETYTEEVCSDGGININISGTINYPSYLFNTNQPFDILLTVEGVACQMQYAYCNTDSGNVDYNGVYATVSGINPDLVLNSTVTLSGNFVCDSLNAVRGTFTISIYVQEV